MKSCLYERLALSRDKEAVLTLSKEGLEVATPQDIVIVLGRYKDQILVKYAMQGITNQLFVSRYQLYLPDKEQLQQELSRLLENE